MVIFHSYVSLPEGSCFQPTASQSQTQEVNRIVSKPDPTPLPCFHAQPVDDSPHAEG